MGLVCLPIHVWDRELDSRIILGAIAADQGHDVLLGHEYNISGLYKSVPNLYQLHNGRPTNSYRSKDWRKPIKENGGHTSLIFEEGINDQNSESLKKQYVGVTETSLSLVDKLFCWTNFEKDSIEQLIATKFNTKSIVSDKLKVCSNTRFELLGDLGRFYFKKRIESIKTIFNDYILISDNFGVEQFGGDKPLDQRKRYQGMLNDNEEIDRLIEIGKEANKRNLRARENFCNVINQLIHLFPETLFIIRPHPISDPRFWFNNIKPTRNSQIIYRDSIEPWIHGALCVIHSACTVGMQSELAKIPSIDISSLINDDRHKSEAVSSKMSSYKIKTGKELLSSIKSVLRKSNKDNLFTNPLRGGNINEKLLFNQNTLGKPAFNFLNHKYGLPKVSATLTYLDSINDYFYGSDYKFSKNIFSHLNKQRPNPNKSRYFEYREIKNRLRSACSAMDIPLEVKCFKLPSDNTYFFKRIASH